MTDRKEIIECIKQKDMATLIALTPKAKEIALLELLKRDKTDMARYVMNAMNEMAQKNFWDSILKAHECHKLLAGLHDSGVYDITRHEGGLVLLCVYFNRPQSTQVILEKLPIAHNVVGGAFLNMVMKEIHTKKNHEKLRAIIYPYLGSQAFHDKLKDSSIPDAFKNTLVKEYLESTLVVSAPENIRKKLKI